MAISNPLKNQEIHTAGGNTNKPPFSHYTEKKKFNQALSMEYSKSSEESGQDKPCCFT